MDGTQALTFVAAVVALLATPGPTNTLLAASGAAAGVTRSLKLLLAENAGYLISISILAVALGPLVAAKPALALAIRLAAAAWLTGCAVQLWAEAGRGFGVADASITMTRVFVTTLLNPKALIFAFVIFPRGTLAELAPWLAAFSGLVVIVATGWIALGATLAYSAGTLVTPRRVWRVAAVGIAGFAVVVAGSAIGAMQ